ncbi:MAG: hypothetical protein J7518_11450 [Nocardioidaceae bacterium]|nr:hypothetical protein [Nocardioidaceae bacterium]
MRSLVVALVLATAGCGAGADTTPARRTTLSGTRVATMAETALEAQNPRIAPGTMTCPRLRLEVGREVRCRRTAVLPGGRQVRLGVTVRVTSEAGAGRLHVEVDR